MSVNLDKRLTKNFKLEEFLVSEFYNKREQRKVIESVEPRTLINLQTLADNLQVLRDELDRPIHVNIGFRPKWWEIRQGRSGKSQHVKGKAADIRVYGVPPAEVYKVIESLIEKRRMKQGGLSAYSGFVHYDVAGTKRRW